MVHLVVGMPCYDGRLQWETAKSLMILKETIEKNGHDCDINVVKYCRFKLARSILFSSFATSSATHLLSVDADMGFKPSQVLRMLRLDVPLVLTPGPTKSRHSRWAVDPPLGQMAAGTDGFSPQCRTAGLCLALVRQDALAIMRKQYPRRRRAVTPQGAIPLYTWFDDYPGEIDIEPDHAFLQRWRDAGGKVWCDTRPEVTHFGYCEYDGQQTSTSPGRVG